jgi:predicted nucleic acid-binding protein
VAAKQNASIDASFWINICEAGLIQYVNEYFLLHASPVVAREIRYPIDVLGLTSQTAAVFIQWVQSGKIILQEPERLVNWFQDGENTAIALAVEHDLFLLMDDANPDHRAKAVGLKVIGSSESAVLLYDHGWITFDTAASAIRQTHASRKQKRLALVTLETLRRSKER